MLKEKSIIETLQKVVKMYKSSNKNTVANELMFLLVTFREWIVHSHFANCEVYVFFYELGKIFARFPKFCEANIF